MIPDSVNILGRVFNVCRVDGGLADGTLGLIDFTSSQILIRNDLLPDTEEQVIMHEIMHGILAQLGYEKLSNREKFVQQLAIGLHSVFGESFFGGAINHDSNG